MARGARARLFVAVDPPAVVREQLAAWARRAAAALRGGEGDGSGTDLRLLDPGLLHLTLCFLGSRPVAEIAAIERALDPCAGPVAELATAAPLWLPARRPRALSVEIADPHGQLHGLQACVARELADASSLKPERRRFRAHITVARVRSGRNRASRAPAIREGEGRPSLPATPRVRFEVPALILYRSHLGPAGASYEALAAWPLKGAAGGRF